MENPIVNNRIVSDHTFAVRLLNYLCLEFDDISGAHPLIEEEYEYMIHTSCKLIQYQYGTCPDNEKWYFENMVKNCFSDKLSWKDFIYKQYEHKQSFLKYLKSIKAI